MIIDNRMTSNHIEPNNKLQFIIHRHADNVQQPSIPKKANPSDIGYDLTLIREVKKINNKTTMYDSGISVVAPIGHYIEIVPRSSLSKLGHMMANSIGIIDPDYRGTLKVVLTQVDDSAEPISLPFTKFQLILRIAVETDVAVHTLTDNQHRQYSTSTVRGDGGFGSTD